MIRRIIVALLLCLFSLPVFLSAGDDSMPAYILIRLVERGDASDPMNYLPGYAVGAFDRNQYGGKQVLPKFGQIIVTDMTVGEINDIYCRIWMREVDWEFVGHDYSIDGHRLRVFTKPELVSQSGLNGLTRDRVETFLNRWNATVFSIAPNSVVFNAVVAQAIASPAFWHPYDISNGVFTELVYAQATGVHTTRINYAGIPGADQNKVAGVIVSRGCTVTQNQPAQSRMTFTCGRDIVFEAFKADVIQKANGLYARRKWRVIQSTIDAIVNAGGTIEVTRDQLLDKWYSRLND